MEAPPRGCAGQMACLCPNRPARRETSERSEVEPNRGVSSMTELDDIRCGYIISLPVLSGRPEGRQTRPIESALRCIFRQCAETAFPRYWAGCMRSLTRSGSRPPPPSPSAPRCSPPMTAGWAAAPIIMRCGSASTAARPQRLARAGDPRAPNVTAFLRGRRCLASPIGARALARYLAVGHGNELHTVDEGRALGADDRRR